MPTSPDAIEYFKAHDILFAPGKASNAGGVAVSALEMAQNSQRISWTAGEVDARLKAIMKNIYLGRVFRRGKIFTPRRPRFGRKHCGISQGCGRNAYARTAVKREYYVTHST